MRFEKLIDIYGAFSYNKKPRRKIMFTAELKQLDNGWMVEGEYDNKKHRYPKHIFLTSKEALEFIKRQVNDVEEDDEE